MARRLSQRHGKPRARLDTASTRSSFFSSSASFLCHRFFLHRPAWQFFLFVFRFTCCHRPVWQFSRFVFRFTCCHRLGLAILPLRFAIHLLPPSSLAILPLRFSMSRGEASPRAAIGIRQYAAPPSAGAQSPRPQRPGFTHPLPLRPSLRPLFGMLAFSTNEQHHEETLDNSALFAPSSPLLNWITDRDRCMSSECDGRDALHPHTQFKYR